MRCRIDGVLHPLREFPKELQAGIVSRLKIMGGMNIAERRLPQDGRTTFELASGEVIDVRLASIPSQYGENITLRILEVSPLPPSMESLGLGGANLERYTKALAVPEGGVVIVGPTGSGKSTTLYTTLELVKTPERKVYTVEDPIERKIHGIVQTEVKPSIGLTFAQALRALVRADPDIIMVGEIRDLETAKMAADAAVTGHQVFSTLHTNDAASAVNRLVEMGVPRYLVAAAWRCFVAQRLVRRLCQHCREPETLTAERWEELGLGPAPRRRLRVYSPVGCSQCFGTGYRGRVGLYEVLVIDDDHPRAHRHGRHRAGDPARRARRKACARCATTASTSSWTASRATWSWRASPSSSGSRSRRLLFLPRPRRLFYELRTALHRCMGWETERQSREGHSSTSWPAMRSGGSHRRPSTVRTQRGR